MGKMLEWTIVLLLLAGLTMICASACGQVATLW